MPTIKPFTLFTDPALGVRLEFARMDGCFMYHVKCDGLAFDWFDDFERAARDYAKACMFRLRRSP